MNLSLEGKTALICGSSQGIGLAIAEELASLGANCILLARNAATLGEVTNRLSKVYQQHHSFAVADFSKPDEVKKAVENIVLQQPIHILINNTGGPPAGPITDAKAADFVQAFQQHLIANHLLAKAVLPGMKKARYGRIINIVSTSVKMPLQNLGVSNTIRAAVASWAKTLANEVGKYNITVNNVLPGLTETKRLHSLIQHNAAKLKGDTAATAERMKKEVPMKRFGKPEEVAAVAAFLATPAASYVNGISIPVDGGKTGSI